MDSGGKKRLHQSTELQHVLGLRLHPDSCRGHRDSDRDHRVLFHPEGDEESSDRGKLDVMHLSQVSFYDSGVLNSLQSKPEPHLIRNKEKSTLTSCLYTLCLHVLWLLC